MLITILQRDTNTWFRYGPGVGLLNDPGRPAYLPEEFAPSHPTNIAATAGARSLALLGRGADRLHAPHLDPRTTAAMASATLALPPAIALDATAATRATLAALRGGKTSLSGLRSMGTLLQHVAAAHAIHHGSIAALSIVAKIGAIGSPFAVLARSGVDYSAQRNTESVLAALDAIPREEGTLGDEFLAYALAQKGRKLHRRKVMARIGAVGGLISGGALVLGFPVPIAMGASLATSVLPLPGILKALYKRACGTLGVRRRVVALGLLVNGFDRSDPTCLAVLAALFTNSPDGERFSQLRTRWAGLRGLRGSALKLCEVLQGYRHREQSVDLRALLDATSHLSEAAIEADGEETVVHFLRNRFPQWSSPLFRVAGDRARHRYFVGRHSREMFELDADHERWKGMLGETVEFISEFARMEHEAIELVARKLRST